MNQTTIYIGIGVLVLIVIIVGVMMSRKKTATNTETVVKEGCNLGYESVNGVCNFVACPSGFYNDLNEKKCKRRTKVCAPERPCETVTENPNADDCITDISRCCKENEFAYNNQCYTECPSGTIVSDKNCVAGNCPQGFYNSASNKGGKYRDSKGICKNYNFAYIQYEGFLQDNKKQCKNVSFNPNADEIVITNKPSGTSCSLLDEGSRGECISSDDASCERKGCKPGFYDTGINTCTRDCKNNLSERNINDKSSMTCVSVCPNNTYYNKIMDNGIIVVNECVNNCRNVSSKNFYNVDKPLFNYKINSTDNTGFCISCRQDQKWVYNENSSIQENTVSKGAALDSFENIYGSNRVLKNNVYKSEDAADGQTFLKYNNINCSS
jgi:hypothetical protein